MTNITVDHIKHMADRHHATMKKLDGLREKVTGYAGHAACTLETAGGAWLGGAIEGRTAGAALGPAPINLLTGLALVGASHLKYVDNWGKSDDLNNFGNGFIGSYFAATGYAFGKRWKETGKVLGDGGGHPWSHPYENALPGSPVPGQ